MTAGTPTHINTVEDPGVQFWWVSLGKVFFLAWIHVHVNVAIFFLSYNFILQEISIAKGPVEISCFRNVNWYFWIAWYKIKHSKVMKPLANIGSMSGLPQDQV